MTVLITGGAGFIGQHLARHLTSQGIDVVALDNLLPQVHLDPDGAVRAFPGEVVVGDVLDAAAWQRVDPAGLTAVVHLAAETGTGQSMYEVERYRSVNVDGTEAAARFALAHDLHLISLSSRAVYGEGRHECEHHGTTVGGACCEQASPAASHEDDEHRPVSVYGQTKSEAEAVAVRVAGSTAPLSIVRPQNVIGPGQALHNPYTGVLAAFLAMLREGRALTVYGDGSQTRDFLHVSDLAALIAWLIENPPEPGEALVLNAGSGIRTDLVQLATFAAAGAPVAFPGITHLEVQRAGDITDALASLDRLTDVGAPLPRWSTADAVADFISWSWDRPGAASDAWTSALGELSERGLTS